jgi:hypothetical protein
VALEGALDRWGTLALDDRRASEEASVISVNQLELLHRHGNDWAPLRPTEHSTPDDHDLERRLLRGEKLFRCGECDLEILVVPPDTEDRSSG